MRLYIALGVILTIGLLWAGFKIEGWHEDSKALPELQKKYDAYVKDAELNLTLAQSASKGYQDELTKLRENRAAAGPAPVVRLCPPSPRATPVRSSDSATGHPTPTPPTGVVPSPDAGDPLPGPDLGPSLLSLADRADEVTAQGRGAQDLLTRLAQKKGPDR